MISRRYSHIPRKTRPLFRLGRLRHLLTLAHQLDDFWNGERGLEQGEGEARGREWKVSFDVDDDR